MNYKKVRKPKSNIFQVLFCLFLSLFMSSSLFAQLELEYDVETLLKSDEGIGGRFGHAVAISGNTAIVSMPDYSENAIYAGTVYIFRFDGNNWVKQQKLIANDGQEGDSFGYSVAISGNTAIIGAHSFDNNDWQSEFGAAYIFQFNGYNWVEQQKLQPIDGPTSGFGFSVAIDGNTIIVGDMEYSDDYSVAAYIFHLNNNIWEQQQKLVPGNGQKRFGCSVAIYGNTAIIGAMDYYTGSIYVKGAAYIFQNNGGNWTKQQELTASDGKPEDYYGCAVAINGDNAIVGAEGYYTYLDDQKPGAVYIYKNSGSNWEEQSKLTASDNKNESDYFGGSLAIENDMIVVGAPAKGGVYIFQPDGIEWKQTKKIPGNYNLGHSVALDQNTVLAGGPFLTGDGYDGAAYVYEFLAQPGSIAVSDGTYSDRIKISWVNRSNSVDNFKIYRNGAEIYTLPSGASAYIDYQAISGKINSYGVSAFSNDLGESLFTTSLGWRRPDGRIDGKVVTRQNTGVPDVAITVVPTDTTIDNCLEFDDSGDVVVCGTSGSIGISDEMTIEAWIKVSASFPADSRVGNIIGNYPGSAIFNFEGYTNGQLRFYWNGGERDIITANFDMRDDAWHHVAVTRDVNTNEIILYTDGEINLISDAGSNVDIEWPLRIGNDFRGGAGIPFHGRIGEIRLWNVARDSLQIKTSKQSALKGNESGLLAYWTFDDSSRSSSSVAGDYAVNSGNHGEIFGAQYRRDSQLIGSNAYTDVNGDYELFNIYYSDSRKFRITPSKENHGFMPVYRDKTLDSNTPTATQVDFTDTTAFTVSGNIKFLNTTCNVQGVEIHLNDIPTGVLTDEDGNFGLAIDEQAVHEIKPVFGDSVFAHSFEPDSMMIYVADDTSGLQFFDIQTNLLHGNVLGPCNAFIGVADIQVKSFGNNAGCFPDTIVHSDANGYYEIILAAQMYTVDVVGINPSNETILNYFELDTVDLAMENAEKNFIYRNPPVIRLSQLPESGGGDYQVPIWPQRTWNEIKIEVLNVWGDDTCHVKEGSVVINDEVNDNRDQPITIQLDTTGTTYYPVLPGIPNIYAAPANHPYQKRLQITATVEQESSSLEQWILVTGHSPRTPSFYNTSPELVHWVLRDPPGDNSYSFLKRDTTLSTFITQNFLSSRGDGAQVSIQYGAIISVGAIVSADFGGYLYGHGDFYRITEGGTTEGKKVTLNTTEEFKTSDGDKVLGEDGDVFIGATYSMVYALSDAIDFDWTTNQVLKDTLVAWDIDKINSTFMFTESHIENFIIPELELLRSQADSVRAEQLLNDINRWQYELFFNDSLKNAAEFENNISFSAGAPRTLTSVNEIASVSTKTIKDAWDVHWDAGIGVVYSGAINEIGYQGSYYNHTIHDTTYENTYSLTTGYHLEDDDPGDEFSVSVKKDPHYKTPVFELFAGTSSCPWEKGTQPRDGVGLKMDTYEISDVAPDSLAQFELYLLNTSETDETRTYLLSLVQGSNPDAAIISVGGAVLGDDQLSFELPPNRDNPQIATMRVARAPGSAFDYEYLQLHLYSACDSQFDTTVTFSVHFVKPCTDVTISRPENNWVLNSTNKDTLVVVLRDYDAADDNLTALKLEYRQKGSASWTEVFSMDKASIPPDSIRRDWDVSGLAEAEYELRASTHCSAGIFYSRRANGIIDRTAPTVFGHPQPADGSYDSGDEISITFNENIDCATATSENVTLVHVSDGSAINIEIDCKNDKLILKPSSNADIVDGETLRASISGISDLQGNRIENPVSWEFTVNQGIVAIDYFEEAVPTQFALEQNYPNPFNPVTQIRYALPQAAYVTLVVYNLRGQEVLRLVEAQQEPGYYSVQMDGRFISSGLYIYRIQAGNFIQLRKMLLVK